MATMPELLNKLAEREKAKFNAEQEAQARVRAAEAKITKAAQELLELKRAQEQELRVLKAQYEKKLRDMSYHCRQQVHKANSELAEAEALADAAEQRQRNGDSYAFTLVTKVNDFQAHLQRRTDGADACLAGLGRMMDARVERVTSQSSDRIDGMTDHAREVCAASGSAIEGMSGELQDQMARAHIRAEGRVRFKELCELARRNGNYDMSSDTYYIMKAELINLWHTQKNALGSRQASPSPGNSVFPSEVFDASMTMMSDGTMVAFSPKAHLMDGAKSPDVLQSALVADAG